MTPGPAAALLLPSFLHGTLRSVQQKAKREGLRCGERYREDGSFPLPKEMVEVPPGEVVVAHEVVDFQRERPAWRLYVVSDVMSALSAGPQPGSPFAVRAAYEEIFRETAWGALFFALTHMYPVSAERTAQRLQAVTRFWEPLQGARYLFKHPAVAHTLEELMVLTCGWVMRVWSPEEQAPVRELLATTAARMARATREECIEAILRQMPRAIEQAGPLNHRSVVADPSFQRERLATLDPRSFERLSSAYMGELIWRLQDWDRELGVQ